MYNFSPPQWSPKHLDPSLPGSSSPLCFVDLFSRVYFHGLCNEHAPKNKGKKDWKSLCHLSECTFVPIRLLFVLHWHGWHPGDKGAWGGLTKCKLAHTTPSPPPRWDVWYFSGTPVCPRTKERKENKWPTDRDHSHTGHWSPWFYLNKLQEKSNH